MIEEQYIDRNLNYVQQEAVDWDEDPFLLIAGPGSGKTRVITFRAAKLIEETPDENFKILLLTFTTRAADELRSRLNLLLSDTSRLFIGTYHSFALNILRSHGKYVGVEPDFNIYTDRNDQQEVLKEAVFELTLDNTEITHQDAFRLDLIHRLQDNFISPEDTPKYIEGDLGKKIQLIYSSYLKKLETLNYLDFQTILFKAYELVTKYSVYPENYQSIYKYVCIDEFQDTNFAQYSLIKAIFDPEYRNIFVCADDDQVIYEWNGASHKRLDQFIDDYNPEIRQLPVNYRCPKKIITLANSLISHNQLRSKKEPIKVSDDAIQTDPDAVFRVKGQLEDHLEEAQWIVEDIKQRFVAFSNDIVILCRSKRQISTLEDVFSAESMKYHVHERKQEFTSYQLQWIMKAIELTSQPGEEEIFESFLYLVSVIADIEISEIRLEDSQYDFTPNRFSAWIRAIGDITDNTVIDELSNLLSNYLIKETNLKKFIFKAISYFDKLSQSSENNDDYFSDYNREKENIKQSIANIWRQLGDLVPIETFLQEIKLRPFETKPDDDEIIIMTIHASKGKEFSHVYIPGLVNDIIPSFQSLQKENRIALEEERRNLYVAITRTKSSLTLSYAKNYWGYSKEPSLFLEQMGF